MGKRAKKFYMDHIPVRKKFRYSGERARNKVIDEDMPTHEAMRAWCKVRGEYNGQNGSMTPVTRFLHSKVGQTWDDVNSELTQKTPEAYKQVVKHMVSWHIHQGIEIDGVMMGTSYGRIYDLSHKDLYIDPLTGTLKKSPPRKYSNWYSWKPTTPRMRVILDPLTQLHRIRGIWYEIKLKRAPQPELRFVEAYYGAYGAHHDGYWDRCPIWHTDEITKQIIESCQTWHSWPASLPAADRWKEDCKDFQTAYGDLLLRPVSKLQLSSEELRRYGLRNR